MKRIWIAIPGWFLAAVASQFWVACGKKESGGDPLAARGRSLYSLRCAACHHPNPALDGSLGPAVKGSSLELLRARTLRGDYPPGYTPKRPTKIMRKLPLTEEDIAAIHAFLNPP